MLAHIRRQKRSANGRNPLGPRDSPGEVQKEVGRPEPREALSERAKRVFAALTATVHDRLTGLPRGQRSRRRPSSSGRQRRATQSLERIQSLAKTAVPGATLRQIGSSARRFRSALERRAHEVLLKLNLMRTGRRLREPTGKAGALLRKTASLVPRSLLANMTGSYEALLESSFIPFLDALRPQDRYLDIGPGRARAGREHASGPDAHGRAAYVGLAIAKPRFSRRHIEAMERKLGSRRWRYLEGKRFQDYTAKELGGEASFMAISDVFASTHYWSEVGELKRVFELAGQLLRPGGRFYTTLHAEYYRPWVAQMSGLQLLKVQGRLVLERTKRPLYVGDPPPRSRRRTPTDA